MSLGNWTSREFSQGKLPVLGGGQRRIYRCGVRMSMGVPVHCLVTHATPALYPVSVRRFRRPVMGFLQIRPRGRHPCLDGRFRSLRPVEDFHLLNWQHAWRTKKMSQARKCLAHRSLIKRARRGSNPQPPDRQSGRPVPRGCQSNSYIAVLSQKRGLQVDNQSLSS